jgi:hypothetical protein
VPNANVALCMVRIFQSIIRVYICRGGTSYSCALFVWLINHQPARSTANNQQILLFRNKSNHQPIEVSILRRYVCYAGLLVCSRLVWHTGMVCTQLTVIPKHFQTHAPYVRTYVCNLLALRLVCCLGVCSIDRVGVICQDVSCLVSSTNENGAPPHVETFSNVPRMRDACEISS